MATARKTRKPASKKPTTKKAGGAKAAPRAKTAKTKKAKAGVSAKAAEKRAALRRAGAAARRMAAAKPPKRSSAWPAPVKVKIAPALQKAATTGAATKETPVRRGRKLDLRGIKKELMQRREDLLAKLSRLTETSTEGGDKPVGDRADDASFDLEVDSSYSIAEREAEELRFINVALDRIGNGTYGTCEECGGLIEGPRLKALPYAVMCLKCKQSDELRREAPTSEVMYGRLEEE